MQPSLGDGSNKNIVDFNEITAILLQESEMMADIAQIKQNERLKAKEQKLRKQENKKRMKKALLKEQQQEK